jgi:hypothetical protein
VPDGGGGLVADTVDSPEAGTVTATPQYGHLTRFPTDSSRARNRFSQLGQLNVIGMVD